MPVNNIPSYNEYGQKAKSEIRQYFTIWSIKDLVAQTNFQQEAHCHPLLYQLCWITEGEATVEIDTEHYKLSKNIFLLIKPNVVHGTKFSELYEGYMIHFSEDFFSIYSQINQFFSHILQASHRDEPIVISLNDDTANELDIIFSKVSKTYEESSFIKNELIRSYLNTVLLKVYESHGIKNENKLKSNSITLYNNFIHILENYVLEKKSVKDYAKMLNISPAYLNMVTKSEVKKTAGEVIRGRTILEAQRMLIFTTSSISEIAYKLNFDDSSYFWKLFKKITGLSPKEYRLNYNSQTL
ncbi:AraC-type DNA-binding protein [Chryseobacterium taichungense]|uniref:AraC-type DNA-binding protein n=1 Tax=Chryseobacterium taichungense TaxID=295069 RepID=A0A1H7YLF7_9FLAO|nr:helix-turn-helix domain-containing protein [Chryseobacterium taichungense]SEM46127.1 AraC-type DNA-binding protein [Chryseobacterium taichungense]